jgi:hypothetical protein
LPFYVTSAANNLGEALTLFARYSRIVNEAVGLKIVPAAEGVAAEIKFVGLSRYTAKQVIEFGVAVTTRALREIAGQNIRPTHSSFIHGRNSHLSAFERFFGCAVEFGASRDQVGFLERDAGAPACHRRSTLA